MSYAFLTIVAAGSVMAALERFWIVLWQQQQLSYGSNSSSDRSYVQHIGTAATPAAAGSTIAATGAAASTKARAVTAAAATETSTPVLQQQQL